MVEERINEDKQEYAYVMKRARCNLKEFILESSIELTDDIKISLFDQIVEALFLLILKMYFTEIYLLTIY